MITGMKLQRCASRAIIVITILNLNGFFFMLAGITRVFSPILLLLTLFVIFRQKVLMLSLLVITFIALVVLYLAFGSFFLLAFAPPEGSFSTVASVFGMVLIVFSVGGILASESHWPKVENFFCFVRNVSIISAGMTLASSWLYTIFVNVPASSAFRSSGLFGNPNQAGLMGNIAFALCLVFPFKNKFVQVGALVLTIVATILPFSKSGIILLLAITIIRLVQSSRWLLTFLLSVPIMVLVTLSTGPNLLPDFVGAQEALNLTPRQANRITEVYLILSGEINSATTTERSIMWGISIKRALENFPFGYGLGTFQSIQGGLMGADGWLGSHNMFLMIWGEAGFLPLVVFVAFFTILGWRSFFMPKIGIEPYFFLILFVSAMTSHDSFNQRFINVIFALLFGALHLRLRSPGSP